MNQVTNIGIVNYNTKKLIDTLIMSIRKFVHSNYHVYIFDNSDREECYKTVDENITIYNNTKGQYIDFNKFLERYPERLLSSGKHNNYASAKHCYTIDKFLELIGQDVILLDSDVLLKKDITEIIDKECVVVADVEKTTYSKPRFLPYICYVNYDKFKEYDLSFFDEFRMHGLSEKNKPSDGYDTGASLYEVVVNNDYKYKKITHTNYIVHLGNASWKTRYRKEDRFISANRNLWEIRDDAAHLTEKTETDSQLQPKTTEKPTDTMAIINKTTSPYRFNIYRKGPIIRRSRR